MILLDALLHYEKQLRSSNLENSGICLTLCQKIKSAISHNRSLNSISIPSFFPDTVIYQVLLRITKGKIKLDRRSFEVIISLEEVED